MGQIWVDDDKIQIYFKLKFFKIYLIIRFNNKHEKILSFLVFQCYLGHFDFE